MKKQHTLRTLFKTYIVDALSFMAMGLFCSLILGLIIKQIALIPGLDFLKDIAALLQSAPVVGGSIGMAIAFGLKCAPLVTISAVAVGALGYQFGGPIGAYLASIVGIEGGALVSKRTPVDIIVTPLVAVLAGGLFAKYCCVPINEWVMSLGEVINRATQLNPFVMGVVVSVFVGCLLTLPISSAALCISIGIGGLAAGAATAGCCAQMVGLAIMSMDDNDIGNVIAVGIGTSMLQFKNIVKRPIIWLPPIVASLASGLLSAAVLGIKCTSVGSGMGTAGLVGLLECISVMGSSYWIPLILVDVVLPMAICWSMYKAFKKLRYIRPGDMKITRL